MLIHYIRTPKKLTSKITDITDNQIHVNIDVKGGNPVGIIVAVGKNQVGWALCNPVDKYDKELGKRIAINRAVFGYRLEDILKETPKRIHQEIKEMFTRSEKYFK